MAIIDSVLDSAVLWLTVVSGEVMIFTFIWRFKFGSWWWRKPQDEKEWELTFSSDGWSLSGRGHNPLATISGMLDAYLSRDVRADKILAKTHDELLQQVILDRMTSTEYRQQLEQEAKEYFEGGRQWNKRPKK